MSRFNFPYILAYNICPSHLCILLRVDIGLSLLWKHYSLGLLCFHGLHLLLSFISEAWSTLA